MLSLSKKLITFEDKGDRDLTLDLAFILTLIYPLFFLIVEKSLFIGAVLQYFCVLGLCLIRFLNRKLLNGILFAIVGIYHLQTWQFADNHQWLYLYWVMSLFLNEYSKEALYQFQSRSLLVVVFALATFWKIWDGEYNNPLFFQFEFIGDKRLQSFVDRFLDMDFNQVRLNAFISNSPFVENLTPIFYDNPLELSEKAKLWAKVLSYLTLIGEAVIAVLFGLKMFGLKQIKNSHDWALIGFIAITYSLIPVYGFAGILIILGVAQCSKEMVKFYLGLICLQLITYTGW